MLFMHPGFYHFISISQGCSEVLMAMAVYALAAKTPGKESMAMEAFARALLQLPVVIADNAGYDSAQLVSELRAAHSEGKSTYGLSKS
jgi:T-complex protein 1 subunit beta